MKRETLLIKFCGFLICFFFRYLCFRFYVQYEISIKYCYKLNCKQEERRNEASSRRAQELNTALDSAGLLSDMLEYAQNASVEEVQLIHELHSIVSKMRGVLDDLATNTGEFECLSKCKCNQRC